MADHQEARRRRPARLEHRRPRPQRPHGPDAAGNRRKSAVPDRTCPRRQAGPPQVPQRRGEGPHARRHRPHEGGDRRRAPGWRRVALRSEMGRRARPMLSERRATADFFPQRQPLRSAVPRAKRAAALRASLRRHSGRRDCRTRRPGPPELFVNPAAHRGLRPQLHRALGPQGPGHVVSVRPALPGRA